MKVTVTGRHMEVTRILREFATSKVSKLVKFFDNLQRAEIVFNPERDGRFAAELIVHAPRGTVLVVRSKDQTATAAFDTAFEKLERQLVKFKDKLRGRAGREARSRRRLQTGTGTSTDVTGGKSFGDIWW